jgi:hypothetical protein
MQTTNMAGSAARGVLRGATAAAVAYGAYAGVTWLRYGRPPRPDPANADPLLDRFMPEYEVVDRRRIHVRAPVETTFAASRELDIQQSAVVRGIFKGREWILGADRGRAMPRGSLLEQTQALGWQVLAENPGREIVLGTVTQPWKPDPIFRPVAPDGFREFAEPDYVKIVWNLRADPDGNESAAITETRVAATDAGARRKFRRYWAAFSPGIALIRYAALGLVKRDAENRATKAAASQTAYEH